MNFYFKNILKNLLRQLGEIRHLLGNPKTRVGLFVFLGVSLIFVVSKMSETKKVVYRDYQSPVFKEGRILGSQTSSYLKNKEIQLGKTAKRIMAENKVLQERLNLLEKRMETKPWHHDHKRVLTIMTRPFYPNL